MEQRQDIAIGLIFVGLGIAAALIATSYSGAGGTYPMVLGIVLALRGGTVDLRALRAGSAAHRSLIDAPMKFITAVGIAVIYVAPVVPLGFNTSSFLLMLAMPLALGFRQIVFALVVATVFMTIVYLVFSVLLENHCPERP